jgi:hypothetical protein
MKEFLEDRTRTSSQTRTLGTRGRIRRRTVYIGTVVAMLAMVGGFALASFTIGNFTNAPGQSGAGGTVGVATGVTFTSAQAISASSTSVPVAGASGCIAVDSSSALLPDSLTYGASPGSNLPICVNAVASTGFTTGDTLYTWTITWSSSAPVSTTYEIAIYISATHDVQTSYFVKTPSSITSGDIANAVLGLDMTVASDTAVNSYSVIVSQCAGSTCP